MFGNIQARRVRALAVSGAARAAQFPDVPTFQEVGVKFVDESSWCALFAPKGTPREDRGQDQREAALGYRFIGGPPEKLAAFLQSEIVKWAGVAKSALFAAQ